VFTVGIVIRLRKVPVPVGRYSPEHFHIVASCLASRIVEGSAYYWAVGDMLTGDFCVLSACVDVGMWSIVVLALLSA